MTIWRVRLLRNVLAVALLVGAVAFAWARLSPPPSQRYAAIFDDAADLVPRNAVRINDVPVGHVTGIALDGLDAKVSFTVADDVTLPRGTRAELRQASLLGEKYVALVPEGDGHLPEGSTIPLDRTRREGEFETLVAVGGELAGALSADNLNRLVGAFDGAIGDDPARIGSLIDRTAAATEAFNASRDDLVATIDRIDELAGAMEPHASELARSIDQMAAGMQALASHNDDLASFTSGLASVSGQMGQLLHDNEARLQAAGPQLNQVVGEIVGNLDNVASALQGLYDFNASWSCIGDGNFLNVTFLLLPEAATVDYGPGHCEPEKGQRSRNMDGQVVVETDGNGSDPAQQSPASATSKPDGDGGLTGFLASTSTAGRPRP